MTTSYVGGCTLHEALRQKTLDESQLLEVAVRLCRRVAEIHAKGIVHNDLKEDSIMLDDDQRVYVIDLGLATREGEVVGYKLASGGVAGAGNPPGGAQLLRVGRVPVGLGQVQRHRPRRDERPRGGRPRGRSWRCWRTYGRSATSSRSSFSGDGGRRDLPMRACSESYGTGFFS